MPILEAEGLVKTYGSRRVVDGVSFSVEAAEIVGLLGPNGAGKTTSFRMTCGMIDPDEGQVVLTGMDGTRRPMLRRAEAGGRAHVAAGEGRRDGLFGPGIERVSQALGRAEFARGDGATQYGPGDAAETL